MTVLFVPYIALYRCARACTISRRIKYVSISTFPTTSSLYPYLPSVPPLAKSLATDLSQGREIRQSLSVSSLCLVGECEASQNPNNIA